MNEHIDWNDRYRDGNLPWDTGRPSSELQRVFSQNTIQPCRTLELGCGTGTNSIWLCRQGFEVTGIDVAPLAVAKAENALMPPGLRSILWSPMCSSCLIWMNPLHSFSIGVVTMPFVEAYRNCTPQPWRDGWILLAAA